MNIEFNFILYSISLTFMYREEVNFAILAAMDG